jgi:hypothetical protein
MCVSQHLEYRVVISQDSGALAERLQLTFVGADWRHHCACLRYEGPDLLEEKPTHNSPEVRGASADRVPRVLDGADGIRCRSPLD